MAALRAWKLDHLVDTASLLVSEVVTNAVLHARTPLTVLVQPLPHGRVQVEVSDGSTIMPQRRKPSAEATNGRGMGLLDSLASSWSVVTGPTGKTVIFTLAGDRDPWDAAAADWLAME